VPSSEAACSEVTASESESARAKGLNIGIELISYVVT
jgi:hypothetical protein